MASSRSAGARNENGHNRLLGERLALVRASKGLSLAEVASAAGISFGTLQQYESGARGVSFGRLVEIAHALDEPLTALVGDVFGDSPSGKADTGAVLRFARMASRLPRAKLNVLVAVAREMSRP
ncbi:helix-turn-helix domain-containing protein [Brevundimonas sp.]|uniref:helix-turn-helix domain-containing protein n=1 Tax=Brevundimonas sp. TaxID=1871086 RepID=UPI00272EEDE7|nr:helix-turn-helix transcriptional regulator [Brevundimonas sp.]MDP1913769.1 helix-turn-helix transcriptional regulator [Brevundimonas sp.]